MVNKEIVNAWCKFLLSDWCSDTFWDNTLNQKNQLLKDLDRLDKLEKVIGILKRKVVNLTLVGITVGDNLNGDTLHCWNNFRNDFIATEQEYKLLKEVLGCE